MEIWNFIKENQILSGAGYPLLCAGALGLMWFWKRVKPSSSVPTIPPVVREESESAAANSRETNAYSPEASEQRPAFEVDGNGSEIIVSRLHSETVPYGLAKATGGGRIVLTDNTFLTDMDLKFPPRARTLATVSNDQLRAHVENLIAQLIALQPEEHRAGIQFDPSFRNEALTLISEIVHRTGPVKLSSVTREMNYGLKSLRRELTVGPRPDLGVRDLLHFLSRRLY